MNNFIVDHAIRNVWCTPDQDIQVIIKPARLTSPAGTTGSHRVMWRNISLPDLTSKWHVYQIGNLHPLVIGLLPSTKVWTSFATACNTQKMICDIYTNQGIQLPRFDTYYMYNSDRDLIVAVRKNTRLKYSFETEDIFIRVYSNAYFTTLRADAVNDFIHVEGITATSNTQITTLQQTFENYTQLPGVVYAFVNGVKVSKPDLISMKVGDTGEIVYDSSIYKLVDFQILNLRAFESILDSKRKYLLHYSGSDAGTIDYQDDIDVFLISKTDATRHVGLTYHKNNPDAFRMVTHRDYSIVPAYIQQYTPKATEILGLDANVDPQSLYVRLHIRKSGYQRALVYENNRIHELYKMSDADILKAMLGIDSVVPNWYAPNLENSDYNKIMRSKCCDITPALVQSAYGYNGLSKVINNTPSAVVTRNGVKCIDTPYTSSVEGTAYEYDVNGYLIGWYLHTVGAQYNCRNNNTVTVEMITGFGGNALDEFYNVTDQNLNTQATYRVYACDIVDNVPTNVFEDVTNRTGLHTLTNSRFIKNSNITNKYFVLRSDRKFLALDSNLNMNNGELSFTLTHLQTRDNVTGSWVMQIPLGDIDVFLNGKSLVPGIDFIYNFPKLIITNKEYLINAATQTQAVHVRCSGFCDSNLKSNKTDDSGFIEQGLLSNNNVFDIRDDRVMRITVKGGIRKISDVTFSELTAGNDILNALNGHPYAIRDLVSPMRGLTADETYALKQQSEIIDKRISDYLTLKIPQPTRTPLNAIVAKHKIFSPFCCKIIFNLRDGILTVPSVNGSYGRQFVSDKCKSYEYLLAFDPTQNDLKPDQRYVIIHPHSLNTVIGLGAKEYKFMQEVILYYTDNQVSLSSFINLV